MSPEGDAGQDRPGDTFWNNEWQSYLEENPDGQGATEPPSAPTSGRATDGDDGQPAPGAEDSGARRGKRRRSKRGGAAHEVPPADAETAVTPETPLEEPDDAVAEQPQEKQSRRAGKRSKAKQSKSTENQADAPTAPQPEAPTEPYSRKEARKYRKDAKRQEREAERDERVGDREFSRQSKRLKAPKKVKDPNKKSKKETKVKTTKPPKEESSRLKRVEKEASKHRPPRGKATALVVDGTHVTLVVLHNGRVVGVTELEHAHSDATIDVCVRYRRVDRLIWCNGVEARNLSNGDDAAITTNRAIEALRRAQRLVDAFQDLEGRPSLTELSRIRHPEHTPLGLSISNEWSEHRLMQRHRGRVVASGQCHGATPGAWLRLGYSATEMTYVLQGGAAVDWAEMPPLLFAPTTVGGAPPDYGSGLDALSKATHARSREGGLEQYISEVVDFVDRTLQHWSGTIEVADSIWVHGPGVKVPGLINALTERLGIRVAQPHINVLPNVARTDQLVTALNAWGHPTFGDPNKIIAKALRARINRRIRRGAYIAAAVLAMVALSTYLGRQKHASIAAAQDRKAQANAELAAEQAVAPPNASFLLAGAWEWLECPNLASDLQAQPEVSQPAAVAVPVGYDPEQWPSLWEDVVISTRAAPTSFEILASRVTVGHSALEAEIVIAQSIAARSIAGELQDSEGDGIHDDIDAEFADAGLDPALWRVFAWAQTNFVAGQPYVPPPSVRLCAAGGPDLLWRAQNVALLPVMFARQMQVYPGWAITEPSVSPGNSILLSHEYSSLALNDVTIFVAWLAHERDVVELLQPLAFHLWGEHGVVRLNKPLVRSCQAGLDAQTGRPLRLCGSTTSVELGPDHLIGVPSSQAEVQSP